MESTRSDVWNQAEEKTLEMMPYSQADAIHAEA